MNVGGEILNVGQQRNQNTCPESLFQAGELLLPQKQVDRRVESRLQVHFPEERFVAGVGAEMLIIGEHMKRKRNN